MCTDARRLYTFGDKGLNVGLSKAWILIGVPQFLPYLVLSFTYAVVGR